MFGNENATENRAGPPTIYDVSWTLASASPRRRALLRQVGIEPRVLPADVEEIHHGDHPVQVGLGNAKAKLDAVAPAARDGLVLAADTLVVDNGDILPKPRDEQDARRILRRLSGRGHRVITAFVLWHAPTGRILDGAETTRVWFRPLSDDDIQRYVDTGEPFDKAGAYGIQGAAAAFVHRLDGCYFNVVGLPLARVLAEAKTLLAETAGPTAE